MHIMQSSDSYYIKCTNMIITHKATNIGDANLPFLIIVLFLGELMTLFLNVPININIKL